MALSSVFDIAGTGMQAQSVRLNTTASNLANAQSVSSSVEETYRARKPIFEMIKKRLDSDEFFEPSVRSEMGNGVNVRAIIEKQSPLKMRHDPTHPMANEEGYVFYPNVNVVEEMTDMISSSRSYQMNVEMMNTAKQLLQHTLTLGE